MPKIRVVVFEKDEPTGCRSVFDIAEFSWTEGNRPEEIKAEKALLKYQREQIRDRFRYSTSSWSSLEIEFVPD